MNSKKKSRNWVSITAISAGLILVLLTLAWPLYGMYKERQVIQSYQSAVTQKDERGIEAQIEQANEYNTLLFQTRKAGIVLDDSEILSPKNYMSILDLHDGMMGTLEIPKISVSYPIYHGVSDTALSKGIGHLEDSSFPVGGESTRAILTGHRGLPSSKLLTRLDEMKEGDLFFVNIGDETLAYQVCDIRTIRPDQIDQLDIEDGKDLVSLVTCTPYGINTHRLVVTGQRIPYSVRQKEEVKKAMPSWGEYGRIAVPCALLSAILAFVYCKTRKVSP